MFLSPLSRYECVTRCAVEVPTHLSSFPSPPRGEARPPVPFIPSIPVAAAVAAATAAASLASVTSWTREPEEAEAVGFDEEVPVKEEEEEEEEMQGMASTQLLMVIWQTGQPGGIWAACSQGLRQLPWKRCPQGRNCVSTLKEGQKGQRAKLETCTGGREEAEVGEEGRGEAGRGEAGCDCWCCC